MGVGDWLKDRWKSVVLAGEEVGDIGGLIGKGDLGLPRGGTGIGGNLGTIGENLGCRGIEKGGLIDQALAKRSVIGKGPGASCQKGGGIGPGKLVPGGLGIQNTRSAIAWSSIASESEIVKAIGVFRDRLGKRNHGSHDLAY